MEETNKTKKPVYKQWWFWVIIAVVAVVIISVAAGGFSDKESDSGEGTTNSQSQSKSYYIGDTVTVSNVDFTVTEVYDATHLGSEYVGADTENNFIVITVKIFNKNNNEKNLMGSSFILKKGAAKYEPSSDAIYLENGFYLMATVNAGVSKTVSLVYETPTESTTGGYALSVKVGAKSQDIILSQKP